ncbi:MAG TPA: aminotransferase class I/II-fold pyridoxal phosphate-dependent enzyme [Candidatus Elarobacter sp.]|nr:aminotransferase class I/II-fold pyridoxal phosphate-dependent enzyme [Candidatus Elarobacter sp.]
MDSALFGNDDYESVQERYFADLRRDGHIDADPSGWLRTRSDAEDFVAFPSVGARDFSRYYLDEGNALGAYKDRIRSVLEAWEASLISKNEFTLCPSGTCSALLTLAVLKARGVRRVIVETPAYFGLIEQLSVLGMDFDLIPTYRRNGYAIPDIEKVLSTEGPFALWMTQPRASLGFNQPRDLVEMVLTGIGANNYAVIDEVTDQTFPSHLGELHGRYRSANLIRLRSFMKGMGLNGFRLSAVIHPSSMRPTFEEYLETFGGSLDAHSLLSVNAFSADLPRFRSMLAAANLQVNELRRRLELLTRGSKIAVNPLENGYIGSMVVDVSRLGRNEAERRMALLEGCRSSAQQSFSGQVFMWRKARRQKRFG